MKKLLFTAVFTLFVTVVFAQLSKTINVTTAGSLSTLLSESEKSTVTDLTVTGNIDARDFRFFESLKSLINLDISSTKINFYFGNQGPSFRTDSYSFPEDEIPYGTLSVIPITLKSLSILKSIKLPESTKSIADYAFVNLDSIKYITMPQTLTSIGRSAFLGNSLYYMYIKNPTPPLLKNIILSENGVFSVYVPVGSIANYKNANYWNKMNIYEAILHIATLSTSVITLNNAILNAKIEFIAGTPVTSHGFCWNKTGTPMLSDSIIDKGATSTLGAYSSTLTNLVPSTKYYVRAFAIDGDTTVYGEEVSFNTASLPASAGTISGLQTVNQGQNSVVYSVPTIEYATSYIWTLPGGASGSSTSNSISVNFAKTAVSGDITVKGHNEWGDGEASALKITLNPFPVNCSDSLSVSAKISYPVKISLYPLGYGPDNITLAVYNQTTNAMISSFNKYVDAASDTILYLNEGNYYLAWVSGGANLKNPVLSGNNVSVNLNGWQIGSPFISVLPFNVIAKDIVCNEEVLLNAIPKNSGTGSLKYKWTPSTGLNNDSIANPKVTISTSTNYMVTVTSSYGCISTASLNIPVLPFKANAGVDRSVVCGNSTQLTSVTTNYTGTGVLRYKWTPSTGLSNDTIVNPKVIATNDITYTVSVITSSGCSTTDDIRLTVSPITVNAGADKAVVCGNTVSLSATSNYTGSGILRYKWTPSIGLDNDTIVNPKVIATNDITYTVTVIAPSGCTAADNIKLTISPVTVNAGADKTVVCGNTVSLSATSNYSGTGVLKYKWTPSTGLNNDTIVNPTATVLTNTNYTLTITTPNGCTASDNIAIKIIPMAKPEIGIVGINNNNNRVVWNKTVTTGVSSYNIYKETVVSNVYEKVGNVPYDSLSLFIDSQSNPNVKSNKYKLSILDRSGLESPLSNAHKTMHLSINKGINNSWNLIWEAYEGFTVSTYNIYRGTNTNNLNFLDATSGSSTQYSDIAAPVGDVYYQLEVISPVLVSPTKVLGTLQNSKTSDNANLATQVSYSSSRSNLATNVLSGINSLENDNSNIIIYPNPVKNEFRIDFDGGSTFEILNLMGQIVYVGNLNNNSIVQASNLSSGIYMIKFKTGKTFEYKKIIKD